MAIYLCGILAGICCGYLILSTTFQRPPQMVASSVRVFGFRGAPRRISRRLGRRRHAHLGALR